MADGVSRGATRSAPSGVAQSLGAETVPGDWLESLALRVKLFALEWRVIALVLAAPGPMSARRIAKRLRLDYGACKRTVRGLQAWDIVERGPKGVVFQPDPARWGPSAATEERRRREALAAAEAAQAHEREL